VWLIGSVVCLLAANRGSNCSLTQAMVGCIVCCGIIRSCQLAWRLRSASGRESDLCKKRCSKFRTFVITFFLFVHWLAGDGRSGRVYAATQQHVQGHHGDRQKLVRSTEEERRSSGHSLIICWLMFFILFLFLCFIVWFYTFLSLLMLFLQSFYGDCSLVSSGTRMVKFRCFGGHIQD